VALGIDAAVVGGQNRAAAEQARNAAAGAVAALERPVEVEIVATTNEQRAPGLIVEPSAQVIQSRRGMESIVKLHIRNAGAATLRGHAELLSRLPASHVDYPPGWIPREAFVHEAADSTRAFQLAPGESGELAIRFTLDPGFPADTHRVTLHYSVVRSR